MKDNICCPDCGRLSWTDVDQGLQCFDCGRQIMPQDGILMFTPDNNIQSGEVSARDRQASGYLQHSKFPTQKDSLTSFLQSVPESLKHKSVLDLGCGPGPSTGMLDMLGFKRTVSVDFSFQSLLINRDGLTNTCGHEFVRADLNQVTFAEQSCGVLMMTDFLQHLGDWGSMLRFLNNAVNSLEIGGKFYLSCFNLNVKHFIRGDIHGTFSNGSIPYSRIHHKEIAKLLPDFLSVDEFYPMNIFNAPLPDRIARRVPGSFFLGRMLVVTGQRTL